MKRKWFLSVFLELFVHFFRSVSLLHQQSTIQRLHPIIMSKSHVFRQVEVKSRGELRQWLNDNHTKQKQSIWLVTYKKDTPFYLPYPHMVEEALCFGWIDSLPRKLDEKRTMHLLSPRKPNSVWSASNKERIEMLQKQRLMMPAGQQKVEEAKKNGSWSFLDDVEAMVIPDDLAVALQNNPIAQTCFLDGYTDSVRKQALQYLKMAKQVNTRVRRIQKIVDLASNNKKFMP
jgi:uncharacterized protein YdeI (YjbR/CyaY-like superfamily)